MTIPELIARIEELDRGTTPGEWDYVPGAYSENCKAQLIAVSRINGEPHLHRVLADFHVHVNPSGMFLHNNDSEFTAASRNLLPLCAKLLREAMEAERKCAGSRAVIMAMEAAMKEVGDGN